jgi:hypothetical protein
MHMDIRKTGENIHIIIIGNNLALSLLKIRNTFSNVELAIGNSERKALKSAVYEYITAGVDLNF